MFFRLIVIAIILLPVGVSGQNIGYKFSLDDGWRFHLGAAIGAEQPAFEDSSWRKIDLPHDWSIEDRPGTNSPFSIDAISQVNGGFTTGGTAWYRRELKIANQTEGKRYIICFDGVYMNADVWINGVHLGNHPSGYTGFEFDVTDKLQVNSKNIVAVEVKNEGVNSRWYTGSGIYRHVWLKSLDPTHIDPLNVAITTALPSSDEAWVDIKGKITNVNQQPSQIRLVIDIADKHGRIVSVTDSQVSLDDEAESTFKVRSRIVSPALWSVESPSLYQMNMKMYRHKELIHQEQINFGIRTVSIDALFGFRLNGKSMKLKGACIHHDNGLLGAASYDRAEERKVQLLKANGFNAIRSCHNPPSTALLDACDREGILVIDESFDVWQEAKNAYDYHLYFDEWWQRDLDNMILRDRNHPSIVMWSIGNEIPERGTPKGVETASRLIARIKTLDSTRHITSAVNHLADDKDAYFSVHDVAGYNYGVENYVLDHNRKPDRVIVSTESYPLEAFESWNGVHDNSWVIGDFVWTGFDYIGEASIGWLGHPHNQNFFPWNVAYCGDLDICGWKRPQSYYRDVLWKKGQVSLFITPPVASFPNNANRPLWSKWFWHDVVPDWNWKGFEGQPIEVSVYSSCPQVELFLNGKSLGKRYTNLSNKFIAKWTVPYRPGQLEAIGFDGKRRLNRALLSSAKEPFKISASADRSELQANNQDLSYITIEILDENGVRNPKAEMKLNFQIDGPGKIVGIGNGNPTSIQSFKQLNHTTFRGRCLVIIKSTYENGTINLKVSSDEVGSTSVQVVSKIVWR